MKSLQEIKTYYPEAFKAKPKGWKFICGNTIINAEDKIWIADQYIKIGGSYYEKHIGEKTSTRSPMIREIKVTPKPPKVPDGLVIPSGHVYIGDGGLECHPSWSYASTAPPLRCFYHLRFSRGIWIDHGGWTTSGTKVIALIDSDLHKAQPWYSPKNIKDQLTDANKKIEELSKELGKQKDELEKYKSFYDKVKGINL